MFIAQGADDKLVRPRVTREFIGSLCRAGIPVSFDLVSGADHEKVARLSAASAIAWIGSRFEGKSPLNSCESLKPRVGMPIFVTKVTSSHDVGNSDSAKGTLILWFISLIPKLRSSAHSMGELNPGDYYA